MAGVSDLGGGKWKVTISCGKNPDGSRKRVYRTIEAKDEKAAEKQAITLEVEIQKGTYIEPSKMTFSDYVKEWKKDAERVLAPKTYYRYNQMLKSRITDALGDKKLEKITALMLDGFYNTLREEKLSEQSVLHHHRLISAILETAVKYDIISKNPCKKCKKIKVEKNEIDAYNEEEISSLLEALEKLDASELKFKVAVHLALASGARLGELMGLEFPDVDYNENTISIVRCGQYVPGKGNFTKQPKNKTSKRVISLPLQVIEMIKQLELQQKKQRLLIGNRWQGSSRLFTNPEGGVMYAYYFSKTFAAFLEDNKLRHIPFHHLRHTSASFLIANGMDVVSVSRRLGHSTPNITLTTYAHHFKKGDTESAQIMAGIFPAKEDKSKKAN